MEVVKLLDIRENSQRVEKHHGVVNHKINKNDMYFVLEELGINGTITGGNFFSTPNPFHVHTDTGKYSEDIRPTHNIVIPLTSQSDFTTVVFDQVFNGEASHFMVGSIYKYWPKPVYNHRKTNFDDVENMGSLPQQDYFDYLTHMPYETVSQLTIKETHKWHVGNPIMFESKHLHCSSHFKGRKEGLTLLVNVS